MKTKLITALMTIAAILSTLGCSSSQGAGSLENKTWTLELYGQAASLQEVLSGTRITITFEGGRDQVSGSSGANTYAGSYRLDGDKLSILGLASTELYRMDPPGVMEQEAEYLKILESAESYIIENGQLKIISGDKLLVYHDENSGILQGKVTIGPITPVQRPGEIPAVPPEAYEARKIMVYDKDGKELVREVGIDGGSGWYVAHLKPGTYMVDINRIGIDSSDDVPRQVEVRLGLTTRLDIDIDTGIR